MQLSRSICNSTHCSPKIIAEASESFIGYTFKRVDKPVGLDMGMFAAPM
jgi:hypothetical protein